ncbi:MAG TPA: rhodanese-like domain-containing protein [Acidimicrobiia bacterium]|nr:rhodanese-like domain-containing protein [Acidimicrobiia bacterium]
MEIEQVPASEWETWVDRNGGMVLDVREPAEWELGTLPGAVRIRLGDLSESVSSLDASKPTLVVCRSGSRSFQAALFLSMSGFKWAANMAGGMKALGLQP